MYEINNFERKENNEFKFRQIATYFLMEELLLLRNLI